MDWVAARVAPGKSVVNMSLGGGKSKAIDSAAARLYAKNAPLFVAAGPSGDACTGSPSGAPTAFAVGATDSNDALPSFSAYGPCVKMFAPGVGIKSAWIGSNSATRTISGSSTSTAFTTGAAALFVAQGGWRCITSW